MGSAFLAKLRACSQIPLPVAHLDSGDPEAHVARDEWTFPGVKSGRHSRAIRLRAQRQKACNAGAVSNTHEGHTLAHALLLHPELWVKEMGVLGTDKDSGLERLIPSLEK